MKLEEGRYKGLTKKKYKARYGSSTTGKSKGENCQATGLEKAIIKYPRSYRTMPSLFAQVYDKKNKATRRS